MNKIKTITLENGLQIIINKNKKNTSKAQIFIKAGGLDTNFKIDNKEKKVPFGTAHFLEHYLIEQSIYGNANKLFSDEYITSNGITSYYTTEFYIKTVHDFEENFIKLLNIVNNPDFNKNIEEIKNPIIQEIKRSKDKQGRLYNKTIFESITKNKIYDTTLGEIETIKNMDINTIKTFHETFYNPNNQTIVLTGNIKENIIDIIKDFYRNKTNKNAERKKLIEQDQIINKTNEIIDETINENLFEITYKVNIKKYTPLEKNKIDYYISYLLDTKYNEQSELFNYLIKNKLTLYTIETYMDPSIIKDYMLITIKSYTKEFKKVIELLQKEFDTKDLTEENFKNWKNKKIIQRLCNLEDDIYITNNFIDNIFLYDLYEYDNIDFIKSLNLEECKKLLNELNYSNYTITINREKDN
jgi:predicted Zn-dependent peptidase